MAYFRGKYYIFESGAGMEIYIKGDGVCIPIDLFNALVVMKYNEMTEEEIEKAEKYALENASGNLGCDGLRKKYNLPTALDVLEYKQEKEK